MIGSLDTSFSLAACTASDNDGENFADLSYTATGIVGTVAVENGVPVLKPTRVQS